MSIPFVGRGAERAVLNGWVRGIAAGGEGGVLVEGEAGIGKTRLLGETLAAGQDLSVQVLRGTAYQLERSRPGGPLAAAFDLMSSPSDPLRARIAHLLRGEDDRTDAIGTYRIVEAVLELIERLSLDGPVIVALENLQWADVATLATLHGIRTRLRHLPVMVMGTLRPLPRSVELDRLVDTLVAQGGLHMVLKELDPTEVEDLATAVAGGRPGPSLRAQLAQARGNPLFVTELVRILAAEGMLELDCGRAELIRPGLSPTLRVVLLRWLSDLSRATLELLRVAAVLGLNFAVANLSLVTGRSTVELLPALDEALAAGVLGAAGDRLTFRHGLVWEALYHDLARPIRSGLHLEIGRALAGAGAPTIHVAEHLAAGAQPGDRHAVRWLHDAGREVLPRDPGTAAVLLQRAINLADLGDPCFGALSAELVEALLWSGQSRQAEALARDILSRHYDSSIECLVCLHLIEALVHQDRYREAVEVGRRALDHAALPGCARAQLQAATAYGLMLVGDLDATAAEAETAKRQGECLEDDRTICIALKVLATVALKHGRTADAVRLATTAVERARYAQTKPDQRIHVHAMSLCHDILVLTLCYADRFREAEAAISAGRGASERCGNAYGLLRYQWLLALLCFRGGQWDDAIASAEAGFRLAEQVQSRSGMQSAYGVLALIAFHRNDLPQAEDLLARGEAELSAGGRQPCTHWLLWPRALLDEARGQAAAALATMEHAWSLCTQVGSAVEYPLLGPDLVRLLMSADQLDRARAVTEQVERVASRMCTSSAQGAALRCRGLLDADHGLLAQAVAVLSSGPCPLPAAQACEAAADANASGKRTTDVTRLLEEALGGYERLGAARDVARVEARLRTVGVRRGRRGRRRRGGQGWDSLTDTELRVVRMTIEGLTNRETAQRLFVSPRTVETHLSHVFAKLGISSRAELKAQAARPEPGPAARLAPAESSSQPMNPTGGPSWAPIERP